jgi:hypothetical protein
MEEIDKNEIYREKIQSAKFFEFKNNTIYYELPRKMKTLFRKKPEMCLFKSVKYLNILLLKKYRKTGFFNSEVRYCRNLFCFMSLTCKLYQSLVLMKKKLEEGVQAKTKTKILHHNKKPTNLP